VTVGTRTFCSAALDMSASNNGNKDIVLTFPLGSSTGLC
jgi:hypothetical protein